MDENNDGGFIDCSVVYQNASGETRSCSRIDASRQITALLEGDTLNETNKILLTIRNMQASEYWNKNGLTHCYCRVETLPRRVFSQGPQETELITRHLQSSLAPLFEDIDRDIIFRWYVNQCDEREVFGEKQCKMIGDLIFIIQLASYKQDVGQR